MSTDLEDDLANALRARADAVPDTTCPPLDASPRRAWLIPAAVAVAVIGLAAATLALPDAPTPPQPATQHELRPGEVYYSLTLSHTGFGGIVEEQLWQPRARAGDWKRKTVIGDTIIEGRVVPKTESTDTGECYPADDSCTAEATWFNPTPEFLAAAPRDPATVAQQLRAESTKEHGPNGTPADLAYLELKYLSGALSSNGVPEDLSRTLRQVVASLPGIQVIKTLPNLLGEQGTAYRLPNPMGEPLTVIFDADDRYIGSPTEAVSHGVAPRVGEPPTRMLD